MNTRLARQADGQQHGVEQLAGAPDEGLALPVFFGARRLADRPATPRAVLPTPNTVCVRVLHRSRRRCSRPRARAARPSRCSRRQRRRRGAARGYGVHGATRRRGSSRGFRQRGGFSGALRGTQRSMPSASRYALRSGPMRHASASASARAAGAACALTTAPGRRSRRTRTWRTTSSADPTRSGSAWAGSRSAMYEILDALVDVDLLEAEVAERRHHERRGVTGDREGQHQPGKPGSRHLAKNQTNAGHHGGGRRARAGPRSSACRRWPNAC